MANKFYLTTTLPYVNAAPHIGFALEIIQADTIARYHTLLGNQVFFNTGTDEHGQKIYLKSLEEKMDPQAYTNLYAAKFNDLKEKLNLSYNSFIRTTDKNHVQATQYFWQLCENNGDIYKQIYKIKYCVGCELEKTDSELIDGKCPLHPNYQLQIFEEENYFFRFSKYQEKLLKLYQDNPNFVLPQWRQTEIANFVTNGLQDFSISRLKSKMPWGIDVPGDPEHVMYVWFDALVNYISCLGWPEDKTKFEQFWPGIQFAGKDNLRQQSAMWQAMLMSASLPNSKQIIIHGFITSNGQKMSKSLGNIVDPFALADKYSTDVLRYYLLKEINPFEDSDFTLKRFEEIYNSDLANGLGNLTSRIITMAIKYCDAKVPKINKDPEKHPLRISTHFYNWKQAYQDRNKALAKYKFNVALEAIWRFLASADKFINDQQPWKLATENKERFDYILYGLLDSLHQIAWMINPFLPATSLKIAESLDIKELLKSTPLEKDSWVNIQTGTKINPIKPLFPRL